MLAFILKIPLSSNYSRCWLKCKKKLRRLKNEKHEILLFMKFQIKELFLTAKRIMQKILLSFRQSALSQQLITENSIEFKKKIAVLLFVKKYSCVPYIGNCSYFYSKQLVAIYFCNFFFLFVFLRVCRKKLYSR